MQTTLFPAETFKNYDDLFKQIEKIIEKYPISWSCHTNWKKETQLFFVFKSEQEGWEFMSALGDLIFYFNKNKKLYY